MSAEEIAEKEKEKLAVIAKASAKILEIRESQEFLEENARKQDKERSELEKAESTLRYEKFEEAEKQLLADTDRVMSNLAKICPNTSFFKEVFELLEDFQRAMATTRRNSKVTFENVDELKKRIISLESSNDKLVVKLDLVLKKVR